MLGPGDSAPDVQVWSAPREEARPLKQVLGAGYDVHLARSELRALVRRATIARLTDRDPETKLSGEGALASRERKGELHDLL